MALRVEAEALRTKAREQAALIDRLQRRLGQGYVVPGPIPISPAPASGDSDYRPGARKPLRGRNRAEGSPLAAAGPFVVADASGPEQEREIRTLKARAEDQAGEIARLKAALAAFEQTDSSGGLKNSKLALKARAGSAEAQTERQAATISRLRVELAAANERLARQAAHFMDEMRQIGGGTGPASGQARGMERRKLVERVAQVRPALATEKPKPPSDLTGRTLEATNGAEKTAGNGHVAKLDAVRRGKRGNCGGTVVAPPAAEMPQTAAIPEARRKPRLLDRITSLAKS